MRIIGPNLSVVLRLRGGVVAQAARPVSYMRGWELARVRALAERWGWRIEFSDLDRGHVTPPQQQPEHSRGRS